MIQLFTRNRYILSILGIILVIHSGFTFQKPEEPIHFTESCFQSEIIIVEESESCKTYKIRVFTEDACDHGLSHFTFVPACGKISGLKNSNNWKMEKVDPDPTTGLYGFKIDDIKNFGESNDAQEFFIEFEWCQDESCDGGSGSNECWTPVVAYKASNEVDIDTLEFTCRKLVAELTSGNPSCHDISDGWISVNILDGEAPFTYSWNGEPGTEQLSDLTSGTYTIKIIDGNGEELELSAVLTAPAALWLEANVVAPVCNYSADGAIDLLIGGGTGADYQVNWMDGSESISRTGLKGGIYTVEVKDSIGCKLTRAFTVEPVNPITIESEITNPTCANSSNGSILVSVTGGSGSGYTYQWSNGANSATIGNLTKGNYSLTVTDINGCFVTESFTLTPVSDLSVNPLITPTSCNDADGSIDLQIQGAAEPLSIYWSNGSDTEKIDGLSKGTYYAYLIDAQGCTYSGTYLVPENNNNLNLNLQTTSTSCADESSGSINTIVSGGSGPYTYLWSTGETTSGLTEVGSQEYSVTVTDVNQCEVSATALVGKKSIGIYGYLIHPTCNASEDGQIYLTPYDGIEPYNISWQHGTTDTNLTGLSSGKYSVTVSDEQGCTAVKEFYLNDPEPVLINAVIREPGCGTETGSISLSPSGGTGPYSYQWSNGSTDSNQESLAPGEYQVLVTDTRNCVAEETYTLNQIQESLTCLIESSLNPEANSTGNILSTMVNAASYEWTLESSDGSWSLNSTEAGSAIEYTAGVENSTAIFTLSITSEGGCILSCSLSLNAESLLAEGNDPDSDGDSNDTDTGNQDPTDPTSPDDENPVPNDSTSVDDNITNPPDDGGTDPGSDPAEGGITEPGDGETDPGSGPTDDESTDPGEGGTEGSDPTDNGNTDPGDGDSDSEPDSGQNPGNGTQEPGEYDNDDQDGRDKDHNDNKPVPGNPEECDDTYHHRIVSSFQSGTCTTYIVEVESEGFGKELSHLTFGIPCGTVLNISNSSGWEIEMVQTDPTTGLSGFKIDDIRNFGGDGPVESFRVTFTLCDDVCIDCQPPTLGYKSSTCVQYEEMNICNETSSGIAQVSPNPFNDVATLSYQIPTSGYTIVELFTLEGFKVATLYSGSQLAAEIKNVSIDGEQLQDNIYLYKITAPDFIHQGKIVIVH
jgi:hypothetical protein